jgi:hypothetical protein
MEECEFKCKQKGNLKRHLAEIHDIDVKWFHCEMEECEFKCKQKGDLKRHLASVHDIDVEWYHCDLCNYKCKRKSNLKQHEKTHSTAFKQRQKHKEENLFKFLSNHFDIKREHHVDFSCFNRTFARLDFVIITNGTVFIIENDEFQHASWYHNTDVSCETKRMMDIHSAFTVNGNTIPICFIRFNPDTFHIDKTRGKRPIKERYKDLKQYIDTYTPVKPFQIHYMFYDTQDGVPVIFNDPLFPQSLIEACSY